MGLSHKIMNSLVVMHPDLLLQNHILPPALPEQMAVHRHRKRKHPHRQRGVLHSLRLRHYVEQSHRIVSLYFPAVLVLLLRGIHCLLRAPGFLTVDQETLKCKGACVCTYSVCIGLTLLWFGLVWVWHRGGDCAVSEFASWRCFVSWFNRTICDRKCPLYYSTDLSPTLATPTVSITRNFTSHPVHPFPVSFTWLLANSTCR